MLAHGIGKAETPLLVPSWMLITHASAMFEEAQEMTCRLEGDREYAQIWMVAENPQKASALPSAWAEHRLSRVGFSGTGDGNNARFSAIRCGAV